MPGRSRSVLRTHRIGTPVKDDPVTTSAIPDHRALAPAGPASVSREIGPVLDSVIGKATQRLIVACFASHVHRVQQVLEVAEQHGRKVCFVGRSMVRNMGIAAELGILRVPPGLLVELDEALAMPEHLVGSFETKNRTINSVAVIKC